MARYMMSSSTSSEGSAAAMRRRPSRMAPTITAPTPKYSIQVADRPSVRNTIGSAHSSTPRMNKGASLAHDVVCPCCLTR
ncbi:hypothetical protein D3C77_597930 [compost metagenome]